jgi:hypothetical protein
VSDTHLPDWIGGDVYHVTGGLAPHWQTIVRAVIYDSWPDVGQTDLIQPSPPPSPHPSSHLRCSSQLLPQRLNPQSLKTIGFGTYPRFDLAFIKIISLEVKTIELTVLEVEYLDIPGTVIWQGVDTLETDVLIV